MLKVFIQKGEVFGALATNPNVKKANETEKKSSFNGIRQLVASLAGEFKLLAEGEEEELPWYQVAQETRVKVEVDMPWGVAAIRGSFWGNTVTDTGNSTSLLEGSAVVTAGGQTVAIQPGNSTNVTSANTPPAPPVPMTAAQVTAWAQQAAWLQTVAQAIQANQAAVQAPAVINAPTAPTIVPVPTVNILNLVNQALTQVQQAAGITNPVDLTKTVESSPVISGSGASSPISDTSSSARKAVWSLQDVASVVYNSETVVLTQDLYIVPPAGVVATNYVLKMKGVEQSYTIGSKQIGCPLRLLAKATEDMSKFFVVFTDTSEDYYYENCENGYQNTTGIYGLDSSVSDKSGTLTNLATKTISGTITLQSPYVAPAGGIQVDVSASDQGYYTNQLVTIPADASTVNYTLNVPDNISSGYHVSCWVSGDDYTDAYINESNSSTVDVTTGNAIKDIVINVGKYIKGTIILPTANDTDEALWVTIEAYNSSNNYGYQSLSIPKGADRADYYLAVPSGEQYTISYYLNQGIYTNENQCWSMGYYSSPTVTVTSASGATPITMTDNVSGIDLTVQTGYGFLISGNVNLPGTETAPSSGIYLNKIYAQSSYQSYYATTRNIAGGSHSVPYAINVPNTGTYSLSLPYISPSNLYELAAPVAVTVYADQAMNLPVDLNLTTFTGSSSTGTGMASMGTPGLLPGNVPGHSLLLGSRAFYLGDSEYTQEIAAQYNQYSWYYKSEDANWFNLRASGADSSYLQNTTNARSEHSLPTITEVHGAISFRINQPATVINGKLVVPMGGTLTKPYILNPEGALLSFEQPDTSYCTFDLQPECLQFTVTPITPGESIVTLHAVKDGLPDMNLDLPITVVDSLTASLYGNTLTVSKTGEGLWSIGDTVQLRLSDWSSQTYVQNMINANIIDANTITITLPSGIIPGDQWTVWVVKQSGNVTTPLGVAHFTIN